MLDDHSAEQSDPTDASMLQSHRKTSAQQEVPVSDGSRYSGGEPGGVSERERDDAPDEAISGLPDSEETPDDSHRRVELHDRAPTVPDDEVEPAGIAESPKVVARNRVLLALPAVALLVAPLWMLLSVFPGALWGQVTAGATSVIATGGLIVFLLRTFRSDSRGGATNADAATHADLSRRRRLVALVLGAILILGVNLAVFAAAFVVHARDISDVDSARTAVLADAPRAVADVLSYAPKSIDADVARAKRLVAGDYLAQYTEQATSVVIPAARERGVALSTKVTATSLTAVSATRATLLMVLAGQTTSSASPESTDVTSTVRVVVERHGNHWLITELTPL